MVATDMMAESVMKDMLWCKLSDAMSTIPDYRRSKYSIIGQSKASYIYVYALYKYYIYMQQAKDLKWMRRWNVEQMNELDVNLSNLASISAHNNPM